VIQKNPKLQSITAEEISTLTGISVKTAKGTLGHLGHHPGFWSSARGTGGEFGQEVIGFSGDAHIDVYLNYKDISSLLEETWEKFRMDLYIRPDQANLKPVAKMGDDNKTKSDLDNSDFVFISYSHDSAEHQKRVADLSARLRGDGVRTVADFYIENPPEGWPTWMEKMIRDSKFTLIISSEEYLKKLKEYDSSKGKGVKWEGAIITQEIYNAGSRNEKFIPVFWGEGNSQFVPEFLNRWTYYDLEVPRDYEKLYARVSDQLPEPPPVGKIRKPLLPESSGKVVNNQNFRIQRSPSRTCQYCGFPNEIGVHALPADEVGDHQKMACPSCGTETLPICAVGMGHFIYLCEKCGHRWSNI
jgi:hypothetical protein